MEQLSPQVMHRLVFTVLMQHLPESQCGPALHLLTDAMNHTQAQIRELAIVAIAELPIGEEKRVESLSVGLRDQSPRVRRRAARAIGDQGPAAISALPLLISGIKDPDPSVRRDCVGALGRMGPSAYAAVPLMMPLLSDSEVRTRVVTAVALKRIGRGAVSSLLNGLLSNNPEMRGRCITLLSQIAPDDERVALALAAVDEDADLDVQIRIDEAMMAVRTPPPTPMPMRAQIQRADTNQQTPLYLPSMDRFNTMR
jgi:HEAT repeat protein